MLACVGGVNERVNLQAICYKQSAICMTAPFTSMCVCVRVCMYASVFVNSRLCVCVCECVEYRQKHATWIASLQTSRRRLVTVAHSMHMYGCVYTFSAYTHYVEGAMAQ